MSNNNFCLKGFLLAGLSLILNGCGHLPEAGYSHSYLHRHEQDVSDRVWLAGDHHVHSEYSAKWTYFEGEQVNRPPEPILRGDAIYPIAKNVEMGRAHGLDWMVTTDHGGPFHSKLNLEKAYPDVLAARKAHDDVVIFYGMEFDSPGAEHSSLIIPHTHDEAERLFEIESQYNKREPFPKDGSEDLESRMDAALRHMKDLPNPPVIIANHPSRTKKNGQYTKVEPSELRRWNDIAPNVAVGMEGAPGHQASTVSILGKGSKQKARGGYNYTQTLGGFDPMTAQLGGFWDSMLAEGRRWWITANSDSHRHWKDGGDDFWPGEYSKTYIRAHKNYDSILENFRKGQIFVTTGDLISELTFLAEAESHHDATSIGGQLHIHKPENIRVHIGFKDPDALNFNDENPSVTRVDLIIGDVLGKALDSGSDQNPTTRVYKRLYRDEFQTVDGEHFETTLTLPLLSNSFYLRLRGTSTAELEPELDPRGEDPWSDLWFYSNPIFVHLDDHEARQ